MLTQRRDNTWAESGSTALVMQGLETTVGKERWTIRSGTAVVATRTQVHFRPPFPYLQGKDFVDHQDLRTGPVFFLNIKERSPAVTARDSPARTLGRASIPALCI